MKEKHECRGSKKPTNMAGMLLKGIDREAFKCNANATVNENGKWYCKKHSPSAIKAREEKSWQTYINRLNRNLEKNPIN